MSCLTSAIARTYVALAQAFDAHDVAQADHERATRLLELGRQRVAAGLDNQLQIRNAESAVASAEQQMQASEHEVEITRHALAALLGQGPDRGLSIDRPTVLKAPTPAERLSRLALCDLTARVISRGLELLGIEAPDRM